MAARNASDLLTADEVIDRLVERPALRKKALTCVLPAIRVCNEWRFRRGDLEAWIESQMPSQPARLAGPPAAGN